MLLGIKPTQQAISVVEILFINSRYDGCIIH